MSLLRVPVSVAVDGAVRDAVRIAPGARTFWHSHTLGQTLHVTAGAGYVCQRGESPQEIRAGDTVWIDDLHIDAPDHAEVILPDAYIPVFDSSWSQVKALY